MRVRHLLFGCLFAVLTACSLAAQAPALSGIETPYPALRNQVKVAGQTFNAGVCTYGPVSTPVTLWGSNLGTSGTVQFIPYNSGVAGTPISATVTMWTSSMLFLYVPSGVHTGLVKVATGGQTSNGLPFIVTPGTYSGSCPANPPSQLTIVSTSLPDATVGQAYDVTLQANGGISPYTWSITSGTLPSGLSLSSSGDITGTPTAAAGPVNITVKVVDHSATVQSATQQLSITVGAQNPTSGQIYSYTASFDGVGNVNAYNDSVMGNWSFGYDTLNRLSAATISSGPYSDDSICWSYDSFGNRTDQQIVSGGGFTNSIGAPCQTAAGTNLIFDMREYYTVNGTPTGADNGKNQATGTSAGAYAYDAAGNVTSGSGYQYLYDPEGRICAVQGSPNTGYLYDAEGRRIAKGTITSWSCDPSVNGFQLTESYALGQGGEQMSMFNGSGQWQRSNVYGAGRLLATYDASGLHFHVIDPLGTRRVQVNGNSATAGIPELDYQSLPFGDMPQTVSDPNAISGANDATPLHFTGKERDTESGNDYFGARYYASSMGRFMSPDPSGLYFANPTNPQSLNLYAYAYNNPLINIDPSGMECVWDNGSYDSADDRDTGEGDNGSGMSASDKCGAAGGTWEDPSWFENMEGTQYGDWSGQASSQIQFDMLTPSSTVNTPNDAPTLDQINSMLVAGSIDDFFKWLSCNGKQNCYPGAQYPLSNFWKYSLGGLSGKNNYCGPNGAGDPLSTNDWVCAVHDYNYRQIGGVGTHNSFFSNPSDSVLTTPLLRQADANLATHVFGAEGLAIKAIVAAGAANTWVHNQF